MNNVWLALLVTGLTWISATAGITAVVYIFINWWPAIPLIWQVIAFFAGLIAAVVKGLELVE